MNIHKKNGTLVQRGFRDNSKIKMCIKNRTKKKQNEKKGPENNSSHINEESGQNFCGGVYRIFYMGNTTGATSGSGTCHYGGPEFIPCY